ncbi:hypothetical protein ACN27F_12465 [Solwaraspora sp. WMMB335]|uniref:hypothetical protein n=1 Tax=Solwaraspora sp. WMMB335 TaxID=3404118 RepID=UPI003B94C7E1
MRRSLVAAVLGVAVAAGLTGCGFESAPNTTDGTSAPDTANTATEADILAATNAACNQAVSMSSDFATGFQRDVGQFADAASTGEQVPPQAVENFEAQMRAWSATLTSLATGPVREEVHAVLTESVTAIEAATEVGDTAFTEDQIAAVTAVPDNLRAVCQ